MKRCLDIGPGDQPLKMPKDWVVETLDAADGGTYKAMWGEGKLPIDDDQFDLVHASHVIEHVPWYHTIAALKEAYRVLKPTGVLEVHTVDFAYVVDCYRKQRVGDKWDCHGYNRPMIPTRWCASRIFAYDKEDNAFNWHKALFDAEYLTYCLQEAGFSKFTKISPRGYNHGKVNLGISAKK